MLGVFSLPEPVTFRPGFLWGSATAGHQIEGGNIHSHKYRMELDGKFPECSGKACNFRELYRQDIDLLAELGHQAFRLSLEWPRIEPAPGVHDEAEMKWYLQILELLKEKKIRICVTLMHLSHPQWFEEIGEFHRRENVDYFLRHLEYLVPQVAPYADSWIVLNEFNGSEDPRCVERKVNCLVAHARAAELIRNYSNAPVSTAHALVDWQPENPEDFFDRVRADLRDWVGNRFFFHAVRTGIVLSPHRDAEEIPGLRGSCDFWALNYYTRHFVSARKFQGTVPRPACCRIRMIDEPFYLEEFYPEGLIRQLERLHDLPVQITENGVACDDDRFRILYLARHLQALQEAEQRGAKIDAYYHWSFLDNFEWGSFRPRFGLVHVDFKTFRRTPKPSAAFYREVIEQNGFDLELLRKYLPEFKEWKIYS